MANENQSAAVARHLIVQACLSVAVALIFGASMLVADIAGIRSLITERSDALIVLVGAVTTIAPLVFATAIGLLPFDR
jgi:hypothetical protein